MKKMLIGNEVPSMKAFHLPEDAATQAYAFIGRRGSGKTYSVGSLVERFYEAEVQQIILDSVGNWYGLRLSADGKSASGIDIPVLGGLRGEIPLEAAAGALIADVAVDTGRSMILDISLFSKADRQRFVTALAQQLWLRKKGELNPSPIHLVIEECQLIIPQIVEAGQAQMVGAFEEIVRLGRNFGIGVSMITQRPQSVNKNVLNQAEVVCAFQLNGPQERKAMADWMSYQGMDKKLADELPSLPTGVCWFWSPQWLGVMEKMKFAAKRTFDSTATPKPGQAKRVAELKPLDLQDLQLRMTDVIERRKADDPKELRRQIQELQAAAEKAGAAAPDPEMVAEAVRNAMTGRDMEWERCLDEAYRRVDGLRLSWSNAFARLGTRIQEVAEVVSVRVWDTRSQEIEVFANSLAVPLPRMQMPDKPRPTDASAVVPRTYLLGDQHTIVVPKRTRVSSGGSVAQRALDAIAWWNAAGVEFPTRDQVAFITGYSNHLSKQFRDPVAALIAESKLDMPSQGCLALTDVGRRAAQKPQNRPTRAELIQRVIDCMDDGVATKILTVLAGRGDRSMDRPGLASATGYSNHLSKQFRDPLAKLISVGMVDIAGTGLVRLGRAVLEIS